MKELERLEAWVAQEIESAHLYLLDSLDESSEFDRGMSKGRILAYHDVLVEIRDRIAYPK